jgi:chloramphenicol O-acetyltransferase
MVKWISKKREDGRVIHIPIQERQRRREREIDFWDSYKTEKNRIINSNRDRFKNLWENDSATVEDYYELYKDTVHKLEENRVETNIDDSFEAFDKLWQIYNFRAQNFNDAWYEWNLAMWNLPNKK